MSASATAVSPDESADGDRASRRAASLRRWHSITGVVPLGLFLAVHLSINATSLRGPDAFNGAVSRLQALPLLPAVELFGILLPLAFHSLYGVYLAVRRRQAGLQHAYASDSLYFLERLSGVVAFVFLVYHLGAVRLQQILSGLSPDAFYQTLEAELSSTRWGVPWLAVLYLLGLGATVFHFANGLTAAGVTWQVTVTPVARRRSAIAAATLGGLLFFLGGNTVVFFATGSRFVPRSWTAPPRAEAVACPATNLRSP